MQVNGNNPFPFDFPGSESGTSVSIATGPYAVTETKPLLPNPFEGSTRLFPVMIFSANYSKDCKGAIKDGETKTCIITNNVNSG